MAKIEELLNEISDSRVRTALVAEVKLLKAQKRFGLVFEEHLPETVRVPGIPIQIGDLVAERGTTGNELLVVRKLIGTMAHCWRPDGDDGGQGRICAINDLVAVKRFGEAIYPALLSVERVGNGGPAKPWHVLINADNFPALQLLLYEYENQVDMIYIDPPYNSGARDWKYNNDYVDKTDAWRHSKWLSMMNKRLLLAKRLLKSDGVLVVTIDENEVNHLGMLLEEIFPEYDRHIVTAVINPKGTGKLNFARMDEYIMFCVPRIGTSIISGSRLAQGRVEEPEDFEEDLEEEPEEDGVDEEEAEEIAVVLPDDSEPWPHPFPREEADLWTLRHSRRRGNESSYRHQRKNQFYPIFIDENNNTVVEAGESLLPLEAQPSFKRKNGLKPVWPIDEEGNHRCWRFIPTSMNKLIAEKRVILGQFNKKRKSWTLNIWERKPTNKKVKTVWWNSAHDAGTHGTTLLHKILGRRGAFPFPKSIHAVRDTLVTVCGNRPNALILDFFAGSGTTYHATCMLNAEDDGKRRSIMVSYNEVDEKLAKSLSKKGLLPGDLDFDREGICESVTWPRSKFITTGKRDDGTPIPGKLGGRGPLNDRLNSMGFEENIEYFRMNFLDPASVAVGLQFEAILPILWMKSGCLGLRESSRGSTPWFIPQNSPFAVLIKEQHFAAFRKKLKDRDDITHVFVVTDSDENFHMMTRSLNSKFQTVQLYKSYLENFQLNLRLTKDS